MPSGGDMPSRTFGRNFARIFYRIDVRVRDQKLTKQGTSFGCSLDLCQHLATCVQDRWNFEALVFSLTWVMKWRDHCAKATLSVSVLPIYTLSFFCTVSLSLSIILSVSLVLSVCLRRLFQHLEEVGRNKPTPQFNDSMFRTSKLRSAKFTQHFAIRPSQSVFVFCFNSKCARSTERVHVPAQCLRNCGFLR